MSKQLVFVLALALPGCGSSSGDESELASLCGFAPGGTSVTASIDPACTGCSIQDAARTADNDFSTTARILVTNSEPNNGVTVRVRATDGSVFPAGNPASYWFTQPSGSWCTAISTYLNGSLQEDASAMACQTAGGSDGGSQSRSTTKDFDAVEITFAGNSTIFVQEVCPDV